MSQEAPEFVERGRSLVIQKQFHEAVRICRLGLLAHPTAVEGRLVLGVALMALGRHEDVLAEMRAALELEPNNATAHILKAEALLELDDFRSAEVLLERVLEIDSDNAQARALLAEIANDYSEDIDHDPLRTNTKVYPAQAARELPEPSDHSLALLSSSVLGPAVDSGDDFSARQSAWDDLSSAGELDDIHDDARYTTAPWLPPKPRPHGTFRTTSRIPRYRKTSASPIPPSASLAL